jgi:hypothetical protein
LSTCGTFPNARANATPVTAGHVSSAGVLVPSGENSVCPIRTELALIVIDVIK